MSSSDSTSRVRLFAALAGFGGLLAGASMLRGFVVGAELETAPLLVFGLLGLAWTVLGRRLAWPPRGRASVGLASASFQALFPLCGAEVVALVAGLVSCADWTVRRWPFTTGLQRLGQRLIGAWAGAGVASSLVHATGGLTGVALGALAGALTFSVVTLLMETAWTLLSGGPGPLVESPLQFGALINDAVVICSAALLALFWFVSPPLLAAPVASLTLMLLLLSRLERRDEDLQRRRGDLQAIQDLALQVNSQSEAGRTRSAVTRIVADLLQSRGAFLAVADADPLFLRVESLFDRGAPALAIPPRLRRVGLDDAFMARRRPVVVKASLAPAFPELLAPGLDSFIVQPLAILNRPQGALVAFGDGERAPFGPEDVERLAAIQRFEEVALGAARLQDDLRWMHQRLAQAEKLSALGELVSSVAHELNNPLATIIGAAELCPEDELPERARGAVARIRREAVRASRIANRLLAFSRWRRPELEWRHLTSIAGEIAETRASEREAHDIELAVEVDSGLPPLLVDPHQIHEVLLNLVTNAEHAIRTTGRPGAIRIRATREGPHVRVEVADDGPGIPAEHLARIFDPFFTTKAVGAGAGLGLSICQGIIKEHGGSIHACSTPGQGATFTILLPAPLNPPDIPAPPRAGGAGLAAPPNGAFAGARALVIDDDDGVREVLAEALGVWGFEVECADSGESGLGKLLARRFDLALIDLRMPGLGGQALYERAAAARPDLPPVVFSTGDFVSRQAQTFLARTRAPVLLKPFTLWMLREAVERALTVRAAL